MRETSRWLWRTCYMSRYWIPITKAFLTSLMAYLVQQDYERRLTARLYKYNHLTLLFCFSSSITLTPLPKIARSSSMVCLQILCRFKACCVSLPPYKSVPFFYAGNIRSLQA